MAESDSTLTTRDDVQVMYMVSANGVAGAMDVWHALVDHLPAPMEQWVCYGMFYPKTNDYRACAVVPPGADGASFGLPTWTIPGGLYASATLKDWEQHIPEIGTTFARLSKEYTADIERPTIERYGTGPDVVLCLPLVSEAH